MELRPPSFPAIKPESTQDELEITPLGRAGERQTAHPVVVGCPVARPKHKKQTKGVFPSDRVEVPLKHRAVTRLQKSHLSGLSQGPSRPRSPPSLDVSDDSSTISSDSTESWEELETSGAYPPVRSLYTLRSREVLQEEEMKSMPLEALDAPDATDSNVPCLDDGHVGEVTSATLPDYPAEHAWENDPTNPDFDIVEPDPPRVSGRRHGGQHTHKRQSHLFLPKVLHKFGDHSLHTDGIVEAALAAAPPQTITGIPNYISSYYRYIHASAGAFREHEGAWRLMSFLTPHQPGAGLGVPVEKEAGVFYLFDAPPPAAAIAQCEIHWAPAIPKGVIDRSALAAYFRGAVPDERAINSALNPILRPVDPNVTRHLAYYVTDSLQVTNNFMMYAKLIWWANVHDLNAALGHAAEVVGLPEGHDPTFIGLDIAGLQASQIGAQIQKGSMVFVDGIDYMGGDDLQLIYWLTKPGRRLTNAADGQTPHASYMEWPSVPCTVLFRGGVAPAPPQAHALSSSRIWAVITKWATIRCEQQDLAMGLYWVLAHFGIRYFNTDAHPVYEFLLPDLGCQEIYAPRPNDYNFLVRLLCITPQAAPEWGRETDSWLNSTSTERTSLGALHSFAVSTFTSLALYGMNITREMLIQWGVGNIPAGGLGYMILSQLGSTPNAREEAMIYAAVYAGFRQYMNVTPCVGTFAGRVWNGDLGHRHDAATSYSGLWPNITPIMGTMLALDDWLSRRPSEWGLSGDNTTIDFSHEILQLGPANRQGWYSALGSSEYGARATSNAPFMSVGYGPFAINAISQAMARHDLALHNQVAYWVPNAPVNWMDFQVTNDFHWADGMNIIEPCTLMNFNYATSAIYAPCWVGEATRARKQVLLGWRGQRVEVVGWHLKDNLAFATPHIQLPICLPQLFQRVASIGEGPLGPANPQPIGAVVPDPNVPGDAPGVPNAVPLVDPH